jgi:hypothetical protein
VLQEATPPDVAASSPAMTVAVEFPRGDPGTPPHRHSGPAFGYVLEGEMLTSVPAGDQFVFAGQGEHRLTHVRNPLAGRDC